MIEERNRYAFGVTFSLKEENRKLAFDVKKFEKLFHASEAGEYFPQLDVFEMHKKIRAFESKIEMLYLFILIYRKQRAYTAEDKLTELVELLEMFHIDKKTLDKARETGELSNRF